MRRPRNTIEVLQLKSSRTFCCKVVFPRHNSDISDIFRKFVKNVATTFR